MKKRQLDWAHDEAGREPEKSAKNATTAAHLSIVRGGTDVAPATEPASPLSNLDSDSLGKLDQMIRAAIATQAAAGSASPLKAPDPVPLDVLRRMHTNWIFETKHGYGRSRNTLDSYNNTLAVLFEWLKDTGRKESCGEDDLKQFFADLEEEYEEKALDPSSGLSKAAPGARSRNIHWVNLNVMFNWGEKNRYIAASPLKFVPKPKYEKNTPLPFTLDEIKRLLDAAKQTTTPLRDQAILMVLYDTGMRNSECCSLQFRDLNIETREIHIRHGKGDKARTVDINPRTLTAVWNYLQASNERKPTDPLFISSRGVHARGLTKSPLTKDGLARFFRRLGRAANIEGTRCSPHTMRHSFGAAKAEGGSTIEEIMRWLGHTKEDMARHYVSLGREYMRAEHLRNSPVDKLFEKDRDATPRRRRR